MRRAIAEFRSDHLRGIGDHRPLCWETNICSGASVAAAAAATAAAARLAQGSSRIVCVLVRFGKVSATKSGHGLCLVCFSFLPMQR